MKLKEQFFDFEVFPEWWCCVIGKYPTYDDTVPESLKNEFLVVTSDDDYAVKILLETMMDREYCNFGYNIKKYDNIILNGIANGLTPRQLKIVSDLIINPDLKFESQEALHLAPFAKRRFTNFIYQDMLDDNTGSLKEKEACMQLDICESTIPFDTTNLTQEQKAEVITYCKHDVWASMQFYKQVLKPFVATKLLVGKTFGIPTAVCYKSTNAGLSARVLDARKTSFTDTERRDIEIPKVLQSYVRYSLPSVVVDRLCASPEKFNAKLFGNIVSYSNGGIHSIPCDEATTTHSDGFIIKAVGKKLEAFTKNNLQAKSNKDWALINVDASSFYPAIMIFYKLLSRAVSKPELFREMYETRLEYKKVIEPFETKWKGRYSSASQADYEHYLYCKNTSQAYKLILNTTYGASGNKYLDLYDPYMGTSTCRIGQLLLTGLANNIYTQIGKNKVQVIQCNTDGVLCYIRRDAIPLLHCIGDEFTRVTQILLEYEDEEIIWQRDVNNYILFKNTGKEKSKGGFFVTDMIQPGYNRVRPLDRYVCRDAVKNWLKYKKDIVEHIYGEKDISKFVVTCHKGAFSGMLREFNDGRPDEILHKVNRTYASTDTSLGMLRRTRNLQGVQQRYKATGCPPHCGLVNDKLTNYSVDEMKDKIDYMWYIEKAVEMLSDQWYEMQADKIVPIKILEI